VGAAAEPQRNQQHLFYNLLPFPVISSVTGTAPLLFTLPLCGKCAWECPVAETSVIDAIDKNYSVTDLYRRWFLPFIVADNIHYVSKKFAPFLFSQ